MSRTFPNHIRHAVSEGERFNTDTTLHAVTCATCHMLYAIPDSLYRSAVRYPGETENGWKLCCPLGHEWWFTGVDVDQQLRDERDRAARERARHDQTRARLTAQRGAATRARNERDRLKRHATAGVCPVDGCHRHFTNLERHIASKHPAYADTPGAE